MCTRNASHAVAEGGAAVSDGRRIRGKGEYHLLPTSSKGRRPDGWVDTSPITGASVRRITPGYISQRLPRTNTIAMNQAYIRRIVTNPRTPQCNREVALQYVLDNPDRFIPRPENTGDSVFDEHNHRMNGYSPDSQFLVMIRRLSDQRY